MTSLPRRLGFVVCAAALAGCAVVNPTARPSSPAASPSTPAASSPTSPSMRPETPESPASLSPAPVPGTSADARTPALLQPAFVAYYAAVDQVLAAGGAGAPTAAMRDRMSGGVLEQWTKTASDYAAKGYKQTGRTRVESFSPGDADMAAGTASVDFCASFDAVRVVDAGGKPVALGDPGKPALGGTATMTYSDGRWRVSGLAGLTPLASCP